MGIASYHTDRLQKKCSHLIHGVQSTFSWRSERVTPIGINKTWMEWGKDDVERKDGKFTQVTVDDGF